MHKLDTSVLLSFAALLLGACASSVHIRALAPAAVPMPANLQSVATANRIIPESRRDKFFDVPEGAFSGEGVGVDRARADECVNVVDQALANNSYRFGDAGAATAAGPGFWRPWPRAIFRTCPPHPGR